MWQNLTENPQTISGIFKDEEPSLKNAVLKAMDFNYNGPIINLNFEIENFPLRPPTKWIIKGYNTAQIWMKLIDVNSIKLNGWGRNNIVDISLIKIDNELIYLKAIGRECNIEIKFKWLDAGVTGYKKSVREEWE